MMFISNQSVFKHKTRRPHETDSYEQTLYTINRTPRQAQFPP